MKMTLNTTRTRRTQKFEKKDRKDNNIPPNQPFSPGKMAQKTALT